MTKKRYEVLINPSEKEMLEREPLMAFSFYLSGRNNLLLSLLDEIIERLNSGFSSGAVNKNSSIQDASDQMWLWTFGAYEVVRTISQANECFSETFNEKIAKLKKNLSIGRMPASKLEKPGKKIPISSNRSPDGWDFENKDLLIGDPENPISARFLLGLYEEVMNSLTLLDVKKGHSESYG